MAVSTANQREPPSKAPSSPMSELSAGLRGEREHELTASPEPVGAVSGGMVQCMSARVHRAQQQA